LERKTFEKKEKMDRYENKDLGEVSDGVLEERCATHLYFFLKRHNFL